MLICECGKMSCVKSGVLVIWANGSKQFADKYICPKCGNVVYTGSGEHVGHIIKDDAEKNYPRFYIETGEYIPEGK